MLRFPTFPLNYRSYLFFTMAKERDRDFYKLQLNLSTFKSDIQINCSFHLHKNRKDFVTLSRLTIPTRTIRAIDYFLFPRRYGLHRDIYIKRL